MYKVTARRLHQLTTAAADTSDLAALNSVGLLAVLCKYGCRGFINGRMPCQAGAFTASLRELEQYPGCPGKV